MQNSIFTFETSSDRLRQGAALGERRLAHWAQPEVAFWRLGLVFGLLFLVITPPFQVPDEWWHFYRAYHLAEGKVFAIRLDPPAVGAPLPHSLDETVTEVVGKIPGNSQEKQSVDKVVANLIRPLDRWWDRRFTDFRMTAYYSPVPYLPQAIGMRLGIILNLSPLGLAYAGRLANLLTALLLTGLAIRLLPLMKWGLLLFAMTPMAVFQRSSLSADVLLNALAFVFIALVMRAAWQRACRLRPGEIVLLGISAAALGLCKPPYYVLALLCLMIPRARFGGNKQYLAATGGVLAVGALAILMWGVLVRGIYLPPPNAPNAEAAVAAGADPNRVVAEQVRFVMQHPLRLAPLFRETIGQKWHFYYLSFIGILGWLDTVLPFNLYYSYSAFYSSSHCSTATGTARSAGGRACGCCWCSRSVWRRLACRSM